MELIETMYDTAKLLIEASNQIRSGLADAGLSLYECPKIKKALKNVGVAIDDLQDMCEKENICPFCGGDIEEEEIQEDCGIYVRRKCTKCGEEF